MQSGVILGNYDNNQINNVNGMRGNNNVLQPIKERLADLYASFYGCTPDVVALDGAGSDRKYFRLASAVSPVVVGTWGENAVENRSFINLAKIFSKEGIGVPEIYAVSCDHKIYLQEDLGETALLALLGSPDRMSLAEKSLMELVKMQTVDTHKWEPYVMMPEFSKRQAMWDLNYFKYDFLKPCGFVFDEDRLEDDFELLAGRLTSFNKELLGFMYRDFQSRNVMVCGDKVRFIDFQGGRKGPLLYDAVSFLWQSKARFTMEERKILLYKYAQMLSEVRKVSPESILKEVGMIALFRTLQVLGAYGFRGLIEKRAHFIESIPGALANIRMLLKDGEVDSFRELKKILENTVDSRFAVVGSNDQLTVKIFSFSYKRGYPEDLTGNGGGFMFDCRGMHNPGRYEEYKPLTGLDLPVKKFLEDRGEVYGFIQNVMDMVVPSVRRYFERGFKNLQIGFGCTGGRHRSVYCAQELAERLALMFPDVRVELLHREQGISQIFNKLI